mgnify:CR=1 FL=1
MGNVRVIDVHQSVYAVNDEIAAKTRAILCGMPQPKSRSRSYRTL